MNFVLDCISIAFIVAWLAFLGAAVLVSVAVLAEAARISLQLLTALRSRMSADARFLRRLGIRL